MMFFQGKLWKASLLTMTQVQSNGLLLYICATSIVSFRYTGQNPMTCHGWSNGLTMFAREGTMYGRHIYMTPCYTVLHKRTNTICTQLTLFEKTKCIGQWLHLKFFHIILLFIQFHSYRNLHRKAFSNHKVLRYHLQNHMGHFIHFYLYNISYL